MPTPILQTKLYIPPPRPDAIPRPHLIERLDAGRQRKLTLVAAPAGFGKTTLVSEWTTGCSQPVAWLSLDEADSTPARFLTYLIAALQTITPGLGGGVQAMLQSPQPPPAEALLTPLLNEIIALPHPVILVLDDYHAVDSRAVDEALTFVINHQPPNLHLVIATREDPPLPLARLRARGHLTELRAADLRFTPDEAAAFLNGVMGLALSAGDVAAMERRTEGWIAGLQLAALSMRGQSDTAGFIQSFTGSHQFVLDYLLEEVLHQQPESVQSFLLQTSILNRLCGSLCDAVTGQDDGQSTLEELQRANLFIVSLDDDRRWYRYHHLFADLLRQRLTQQMPDRVADFHRRAAEWFEANGLELEAFHHAVAASDVARAERLVAGGGMPLYFRGMAGPVLAWLESLPAKALNDRPSLWLAYASAQTMTGQPYHRIEHTLKAAETALAGMPITPQTNDLHGQIAAIRAMLAVPQNQIATIIAQSRRALERLHPDNLPVRTTTTWALGFAHQIQGNLTAAAQAYSEAIAAGRASGNVMMTIGATTSLGQIREAENRLDLAAETYRTVLELAGDPPWPTACEAYLGLARIHYQWNELELAEQYGLQSLNLARHLKNSDTPAACGVLLARLKLAQGDVESAGAQLAEAEQFVQRHKFEHWLPEIISVRVQMLLQQGNVAGAAHLAQTYDLPLSRARVHLAQGNPAEALAALKPLLAESKAGHRHDVRLGAWVLAALAHQAEGDKDEAVQYLAQALALAEPGGAIRLFVDEGPLLMQLLREAATRGLAPNYTRTLLTAFDAEVRRRREAAPPLDTGGLIEPLTARERDVLKLMAAGRSNPEIAEQLVIAVTTVKTHVKNIFGKLHAANRVEAIARARDLNLL